MSDSNKLPPVIGVGVLVWRDKKLLLGERISKNQKNCWQFPGGHLENDETVIECAVREVMEETGLKIKALRHLGFTDRLFDMAQRKYITLLVSSEYASGEAEILEPDKCKGWQWFDYRQLPDPLFRPISLFQSQQSDIYNLHRCSTVLQDLPSLVMPEK